MGSIYLPGSETLGQVKAPGPPPVHETFLAVPFDDLLEKRISLRLGCPRRSKSASHLLTDRVGEQQNEQQEKYMKNWEERERTHVWALHHQCLEVPGQVRVWLERGDFCYMASFSLWEHLLSFISVSWMYRITLVSARRENTSQGLPSKDYGGVYREVGKNWV